ncbi:MAG: alpha/beta fold hydrolase [Pseudomarimonas sp.]
MNVIAVHGLGDHGGALPYRRLAEALLTSGHRVISYDQREHGIADGSSTERARLPGLVEDLGAVACHLRRENPQTPLVAVGLSMGAVVTLMACHANSTLLNGAVAASAPLGPVSAGRMSVLAAKSLGRLLPGLTLKTGINLSLVTDNSDDLAAYVGDPQFRTRVRLGLASDLLQATEQLLSIARGLPLPTLFLHGKLDAIAPWSDEVVADLQGGERVVKVFEHGYHNLFLDNARCEVFNAITQWTKALCGRIAKSPG